MGHRYLMELLVSLQILCTTMEISEKRTLLIDDHSIVRQGIYLLLKKHFGYTNILQASSISEAREVLRNNTVDFIILDIHFPEGNSLNFVENLVISAKNTFKILIFSALEENIYAVKYIQAGAHGFLSKTSEEENIVYALQKFFKTGKYLSEELKDHLLDTVVYKKKATPLNLLSGRELEIARMLSYGYSNNEIATKLNIQKSTVSTYKNRIFEKLGINNIPSLISCLNLG